jgi:RNA polymerase sigma-70 factor (ECF subfamily)
VFILKRSYKILLEQIAKGNEQAFEELFSVFHVRLHKFAVSFRVSRELADEIVMDVFLKLWNLKSKLITISNLDTYLYVAVRNGVYNAIKQNSRVDFDPLESVDVNLYRYDSTPEGLLISSENIQAINLAVEQLPPKCKMIFKLIREENLSRKEVAEILALSIKTIDNQISIAVRKIADELGINLDNNSAKINLQLFLLSF